MGGEVQTIDLVLADGVDKKMSWCWRTRVLFCLSVFRGFAGLLWRVYFLLLKNQN